MRHSPPRSVVPWLALLAVSSCARGTGAKATDDLTGLTLPLLQSPALQLAVAGDVDGVDAELLFDTASPITIATEGCFRARAPLTGRSVRQPTPDGTAEELPTAMLEGLRLGGLTYQRLEVGVVRGTRCAVALGANVLGPYALEVDVGRREARLARPRPRAEYARMAAERWPGAEVQVLEVTREPRQDWPLVAVRLSRGAWSATLPFVVSTREPVSQASEPALAAGGQQPLAPGWWGLDALELAPGVGVRPLLVRSRAWKGELSHGLLGADVLGRFDFVLDSAAGVLVLHRPRQVSSPERVQCERDGRLSEDACFQAELQRQGPIWNASVSVWRDLPKGGTVHLELFDEQGERVTGACGLGVAFGPQDRGASSQHQLPWTRLRTRMPACAESLKRAARIELGLFEEEALQECPGNCAFAHDMRTRQLTCECAADPLGDARALLRQLGAGAAAPPALPSQPEPAEPE